MIGIIVEERERRGIVQVGRKEEREKAEKS
jgi:hypothetical protein